MIENPEQFESRKRDHIEIALKTENQAHGFSGLDSIVLEHEALPDLDFDEVSIETHILGENLKSPLYVSSMTAGHSGSLEINSRLAEACQDRGWMLGVGSQRRQLTEPEAANEWRAIRRHAPAVILLGNLGIAQLIESKTDDILKLVESLEAKAMNIHLNSLQEVLQVEGTPYFKGSWEALERLANALPVPVVVKETGCGFSEKTLKRLMNIGIYAVDISGFGGTHWGRVEGQRAQANTPQAEASETFRNWGISTVQSVINAKNIKANYQIWASGGVRTGLDAAKLIAMGADAVGFASPVLREAIKGSEHLWNWMEKREFELKIALFCTGSTNLDNLKTASWSQTF